MTIIGDREYCTGCGACAQACPAQCISWVHGELGFRYPTIDPERCISCGKCESVCPIGMQAKKPDYCKAYAAVNHEKNLLMNSTSGGVFAALAEYVLAKNGVVYGSMMQPDMTVQHVRIDRWEQIDRLQGSKYVQSDTNNTFSMVEEDLKAGLLVLYTGTPCQIAGLKKFLGKTYSSLLTADLVCHGVPSQAYFTKFIKGVEEERNITVTDFLFRSKKNKGWALSGELQYLDSSGQSKSEPAHYSDSYYYYYYYLRTSIYRESCYSCPYASLNRPGDFTMGDLWGAEGLGLKLNIKNGCSLLLVNSQKASVILPKLKLEVQELPINLAIAHNNQLQHPSVKSNDRPERVREYEENTAAQMQKRFKAENRKEIFIAKAKYAVPTWARNILLAVRYRIK